MSFEPTSDPTVSGVLARLEYAAKRATDNLAHEPLRWHGWFTWQTGLELPLDLFTKYMGALDYQEAMIAYGTVEDRDWAHSAVQSYLTPLTAIVYSHFGLPKKVAA